MLEIQYFCNTDVTTTCFIPVPMLIYTFTVSPAFTSVPSSVSCFVIYPDSIVSEIKVIVSLGTEKTKVPKFVGTTKEEAEKSAKDAKLKLASSTVFPTKLGIATSFVLVAFAIPKVVPKLNTIDLKRALKEPQGNFVDNNEYVDAPTQRISTIQDDNRGPKATAKKNNVSLDLSLMISLLYHLLQLEYLDLQQLLQLALLVNNYSIWNNYWISTLFFTRTCTWRIYRRKI